MKHCGKMNRDPNLLYGYDKSCGRRSLCLGLKILVVPILRNRLLGNPLFLTVTAVKETRKPLPLSTRTAGEETPGEDQQRGALGSFREGPVLEERTTVWRQRLTNRHVPAPAIGSSGQALRSCRFGANRAHRRQLATRNIPYPQCSFTGGILEEATGYDFLHRTTDKCRA